MRKALIAAVAAASTLVTIAAPAAAITGGGRLDGDDHPYVGLMVAQDDDGNPMWRCSGAFVSPTVYVTAGHCTFGVARAEIWLSSDLHNGNVGGPVDPSYNYPFTGDVGGEPITHPEYVDAAFYLFDLGVVVLDEPVDLPRYASLADAGLVNSMTKGRNKDTSKVTAVGYGLQEIVEGPTKFDFDPKLKADKTRWQADLMIVATKGVAGIGSINPNQSFTMSGDAAHGGTCFGDSGGPILKYGTDVIVAVNSFGLNPNCAGLGGAYRVDQADDIAFLESVDAYGG